MPTISYPERTRADARDSDATLWVGAKAALEACRPLSRMCLRVEGGAHPAHSRRGVDRREQDLGPLCGRQLRVEGAWHRGPLSQTRRCEEPMKGKAHFVSNHCQTPRPGPAVGPPPEGPPASSGQPETKIGAMCTELGITRQTLYRHVDPKGELRPDGQRPLAARRCG